MSCNPALARLLLGPVVAGVEKLDSHPARFRLHEPNIGVLSCFAMSWAGMQSAEYGAPLLAEGCASAIDNVPVGTGPYRFKTYRKDVVGFVLSPSGGADFEGGVRR